MASQIGEEESAAAQSADAITKWRLHGLSWNLLFLAGWRTLAGGECQPLSSTP